MHSIDFIFVASKPKSKPKGGSTETQRGPHGGPNGGPEPQRGPVGSPKGGPKEPPLISDTEEQFFLSGLRFCGNRQAQKGAQKKQIL